jgi:hypothetical protein
MTAKKKGRCWKGCKPVPGKKPFSKGSCSCGMSALNPGMIELMNPNAMDSRAYGAGVGGFVAGAPGTLAGAGVGQLVGKNKKKKLSLRDRAMIAGSLVGPVGVGAAHLLVPEHNYYAALRPGMIELARGDFAIPALKRALKRGVGNAGEPVSIHEIGVSGTMIPSLRKNPKNVQRATKKYWGEDEGLGQASGAMRYNRDWAAKTIKEDRRNRTNHWYGPIQPRFSALNPGMIEFAADNRPRNGMGQYVGNETMGVDPNSMQAAYGNVEQEKMMRRRSLVQRMRSMMGRGANEQVTP